MKTPAKCVKPPILYYSPQKDFFQGSTGMKNGKLRITWEFFNAAQDQQDCNGRVLPQNTRHDSPDQKGHKNTTHVTADKGLSQLSHHCLPNGNEREQNSSSMSGTSSHSPGTVGMFWTSRFVLTGLSSAIKNRAGQTKPCSFDWRDDVDFTPSRHFRTDLLDGDLL